MRARPVLIASINHVEALARSLCTSIRVVVPSCIHGGALAHAASAFAPCWTFELLTSTRRRRMRFPHIARVRNVRSRELHLAARARNPSYGQATIGLLEMTFASHFPFFSFSLLTLTFPLSFPRVSVIRATTCSWAAASCTCNNARRILPELNKSAKWPRMVDLFPTALSLR